MNSSIHCPVAFAANRRACTTTTRPRRPAVISDAEWLRPQSPPAAECRRLAKPRQPPGRTAPRPRAAKTDYPHWPQVPNWTPFRSKRSSHPQCTSQIPRYEVPYGVKKTSSTIPRSAIRMSGECVRPRMLFPCSKAPLTQSPHKPAVKVHPQREDHQPCDQPASRPLAIELPKRTSTAQERKMNRPVRGPPQRIRGR